MLLSLHTYFKIPAGRSSSRTLSMPNRPLDLPVSLKEEEARAVIEEQPRAVTAGREQVQAECAPRQYSEASTQTVEGYLVSSSEELVSVAKREALYQFTPLPPSAPSSLCDLNSFTAPSGPDC